MQPYVHNRPQSLSTGKTFAKRVQARDRTTVLLTYSTSDANAMRALVGSIRLRKDKKPSLSLIARRAMAFWLEHLPRRMEAEVAILDTMVTPVPKPMPLAYRKTL